MNRTIKLSATKRIALTGAAAFVFGTVAQSYASAQIPMPTVPKPATRGRWVPPPPPPPPPKPAPKK